MENFFDTPIANSISQRNAMQPNQESSSTYLRLLRLREIEPCGKLSISPQPLSFCLVCVCVCVCVCVDRQAPSDIVLPLFEQYP
jgi:hypothetical protein